MAKMILVHSCASCQYRHWKTGVNYEGKHYCGITMKDILDADSIPPWCPLPDATVENPKECEYVEDAAGYSDESYRVTMTLTDAPPPDECDDCTETCEGCGHAPENG